jgi:hypothetical protein
MQAKTCTCSLQEMGMTQPNHNSNVDLAALLALAQKGIGELVGL